MSGDPNDVTQRAHLVNVCVACPCVLGSLGRRAQGADKGREDAQQLGQSHHAIMAALPLV